jgi:NAD(P)-dependent dehydrogenase (short-subunit alcohol dehydrogenase family)
LGLGLVEILAAMPIEDVQQVFAACRSGAPNDDLARVISRSNGRVKYVQLDVDFMESIKATATLVWSDLNGAGLDYLFNNAERCASHQQLPRSKIWNFSERHSRPIWLACMN